MAKARWLKDGSRKIPIGPRTWLTIPRRPSATCMHWGDAHLHYEGRKVNIDDRRMQPRLQRLIPDRRTAASFEEWKPFIHRCILERLL